MTLPILGKSLGNPDDAVDNSLRRGAKDEPKLRRYARRFWFMCEILGVRADGGYAQADLETGNFTSTRWTREGNPAGLGITTGMPDSDIQRTLEPEEWAEIQAIHLAGYAGVDVPPELRKKDFRWGAMVARGWFGVAGTFQDLDEKWAEDQGNYGDKIESRWRNYGFPMMRPYTREETDMVSTVIPGLEGGPLVTDYPVHIRLIPEGMSNNPGLYLRGPFDTTQHATANLFSNGDQENLYVVRGSGGRQASWHLTVDELGVWVSLPLDRVGWHASDGAGPGNMSTVACELTQRTSLVNNATLWRRARFIAADIMGRVAARKGGDNDTSWHRDYAPDRKWCPAIILNNAQWVREYDQDYAAAYADEKRRMAGGAPQELPVIGITDVIATTVKLNFRPSTALNAPVIQALPIGEELVVTGRSVDADGYRWLPVTHGAVPGFVAMAGQDGTPYVKMVTDNPDPVEYAAVSPIPSLLETDLQKYDTAERITSDDNGNQFIFMADLLEFTEVTPGYMYAGLDSKHVHAPYKIGERALGAWLVETDPEVWWWVLAGPGDEWVRVPYSATKVVGDAGVPMLGKEWGDGEAEAH